MASRRRSYGPEIQRQFWQFRLTGMSSAQASRSVGIAQQRGSEWVRAAGGIPPRRVMSQSSGRFLCVEERVEIALLHTQGLSIRQIAQQTGRAPSTISRELRREPVGQYRPLRAQRLADQLAARPKPRKLDTNIVLRHLVQHMLNEKFSPEQISNRLATDFGDDESMQVSPETIYQSIYVQGRGSLRRELAACLRTGRAVRRPGRKGAERRGQIPGMVMISQRPAQVEDRAIPGHWEGDLIMGKGNTSAIGTLVERSTRFVMLLHLPEGHTAGHVAGEMIRAVDRMPEVMRQSLTWDQGKEMADHATITTTTGMKIYFCDPHSPWQRGSNENTNGLLRQYFPKGTDLSVHSRAHLEFVAAQMNRRPRKTLDWQTPAERLNQLVLNPPEIPGVATTA